MAARPRSTRKKNWPDHVYERGGYYSYVSPVDGVEYGLGRDQVKAFREARAANNHLAAQRGELALVDRIVGGTETVSAWLDEYEKILAKRKLAEATRRFNRSLLNIIRRSTIGSEVIKRVSTRQISDVIKTRTDKGQDRMALALWSCMFDVFKEAEGAGRIDRGHNPVEVATRPQPEVKRARLTLDMFNGIYAAALKLDPWVSNSMAMALVSTKSRDEIAEMQFPDAHDGKLWVERGKTGARVCIPLELRLDAIGMSIDDVVRRCRDDVVSRWMIHHTKPRTKSKPGERVWIDTITKGFRRALKASGVTWQAGKAPPSFHEIRSLSIRLWEEQRGAAFAQAMAGHRNADTTAIYLDVRGAEWTEIKIA